MRKFFGEVKHFGTFMRITHQEVFMAITFFECVKTGSKLNINVFICQ